MSVGSRRAGSRTRRSAEDTEPGPQGEGAGQPPAGPDPGRPVRRAGDASPRPGVRPPQVRHQPDGPGRGGARQGPRRLGPELPRGAPGRRGAAPGLRPRRPAVPDRPARHRRLVRPGLPLRHRAAAAAAAAARALHPDRRRRHRPDLAGPHPPRSADAGDRRGAGALPDRDRRPAAADRRRRHLPVRPGTARHGRRSGRGARPDGIRRCGSTAPGSGAASPIRASWPTGIRGSSTSTRRR